MIVYLKKKSLVDVVLESRGSALGYPTLGYPRIFGNFEIPNPRIFLEKSWDFLGFFITLYSYILDQKVNFEKLIVTSN